MAYSSAWIALCEDPHGEAMRARLSVRLNDGTGGAPDTLVELTDGHEILSINPIQFRREVEFGVVQGQSWQVMLENADLSLLAYNLSDCWCALEAGFPVADQWEVVAQGRVERVIIGTDTTLMLEVHDAVMSLLDSELKRDVRFDTTAWASEVYSSNTGDGSDPYENTATGAGITLLSVPDTFDETFKIVFTSPTAFDVILEDGSTGNSGTTSADCDVPSREDPLTDVVRIESAGWTGTYASGDEFVFYTSKPRGGTDNLYPVVVLKELLESVHYAHIRPYDVLAGAAYTYPWFDDAGWTAISGDYDTYSIKGTWRKGTKISELAQDILKLIHGSLYANPTGQIVLWALQPSTTVSAYLNGTPGAGYVSIISGTREDDLENTCNSVAYEYKDLAGNDALYTATDADSELQADRQATVRVGWECPGPLVEPAANKYLTRFKARRRIYRLNTTLAGAVVNSGGGLSITEAAFGAESERVDASDVELDILANSARVSAYVDPAVIANYAVVGVATVGGAGVVW